MTIKILDCTLRDGGYYNKWDFNDSLVKEYLKLMDILKVDYVEIGFRKIDREKKFGKFFSITDRDIGKLANNKKFKISVMIDLADFKKDLKINELFKKSIYTKIDLVRIAVSFEDLKYLSKIVIELNLLGYKVAVNLMKFTSLNPKQIYNFFNQLDSKLIDYYYLADSYGNCNPKFITNLSAKLLKKKIDINKLGFHAHDNMKNALKNSLKAKKLGFGIIDTSILGMGRGAGNLKLEDFLIHVKRDNIKEKILRSFIKNKFIKLKRKYNWGSNKYYQYAAKNTIHPTYVQRLLEDKKFNFKQIQNVLNFLKKQKAAKYDINIFDNLFYKKDNNINKKIIDKSKEKIAFQNKTSANIILNNTRKIKTILARKKKSDIYALLNYSKHIKNSNIDYLFLCNPFRLVTENQYLKNFKNKLIVPQKARIDNRLKNKQIIVYDMLFSKNLSIKQNYCTFSLNLALVYAVAYFISRNFLNINIYGLANNKFNDNIISKIKIYIKEKKIKTKISTYNV